ncbi:ankyrin repeat domain-containing protein, partial [bacterium]
MLAVSVVVALGICQAWQIALNRALVSAAEDKRVEDARDIIARGANVNTLAQQQRPPFEMAYTDGHDGWNPIFKTPLIQAMNAFEFPMQIGGEEERKRQIEERQRKKKIPEMMKLLLDAGANPNQTDSTGRTPLQYCLKKPSSVEAQILVQYGAK